MKDNFLADFFVVDQGVEVLLLNIAISAYKSEKFRNTIVLCEVDSDLVRKHEVKPRFHSTLDRVHREQNCRIDRFNSFFQLGLRRIIVNYVVELLLEFLLGDTDREEILDQSVRVSLSSRRVLHNKINYELNALPIT